jgi:uncharacterized membrane-anchored protein
LTYATTVKADRERSRASWNMMDVVASVIVVGIIVWILTTFTG